MGYEYITDKHVKTRKTHVCFGCLLEQAKGSILWRHVYKNDGDICSDYYCKKCEQILNEPEFRQDFSDGIFAGDLRDYWEQETEND